MRISRALPQCKGKPSLFVVTGERDAVFYLAQDGTLEKVDHFVSTGPHYTDREGTYFAATAGGKAVRTGSVKEVEHRKKRREFLGELREHLARFSQKFISNVYLFAPATVSSPVQRVLARTLHKKVTCVIQGNYVAHHPFAVLKKVRSSDGR